MRNIVNKTYTFRGRRVAVTTEWEDYDSSRCCDGGSYYQPCITARAAGCVLVIEDMSCGDFGTEVFATLWRGSAPPRSEADASRPLAVAHYGTRAPERYSTFRAGFFASLAKLEGYTLPLAGDAEEDDEADVFCLCDICVQAISAGSSYCDSCKHKEKEAK